EVADLVLEPIAIGAGGNFRFEFRGFLGDLVEDRRRLRPVEADPGGARLKLAGAHQGGKSEADPVERTGGRLPGAGAPFRRLVLLPGAALRCGASDLGLAEDVGMASDHLISDG